MNEKKFFDMLARAPRIEHLWDRQNNTLDHALFEHALGNLSSGEAHLARFFAAVWLGDSKRYGFDLIEAASVLDPELRQIIIDWCRDPFWP